MASVALLRTERNSLSIWVPAGKRLLPWINIMANPKLGAFVSESGAEFVWSRNSQNNRLTPWFNDPISDPPGTAIYIRDDDIGVVWSPTPQPIREKDAYRARHGQGYTTFEHNSHAIEQRLLTFVPVDDAGGLPVRLQRLRLRNNSSRRRKLTVTSYATLVLGSDPEETGMHVVTKWDLQSQSLFARNSYSPEFCECITFATSTPTPTSFTGDRAAFIGRNRSLRDPAAMEHERLTGDVGAGLDPCAALQVVVEIDPGQTAEITFLLGQADDEEKARALVDRFRDPANVEAAFQETRRWWDRLLSTIEVETPELSTNFLLNRWLLYQTLSCRVWGRSAFYQSSGAYGFRDQLQDVMALVHAAPEIARDHILRAAARQFVEGDVQHWWHPESGAGVRTRVSDDLLWLPFVTAHYVRTTGDAAILDQIVPFLEAKPLEAQQIESLSIPVVAHTEGTLLEHCRRAIARSATAGPHGLPLIGGGDWNDGLNRVGLGGKGESVWLAWFEICVLSDFAELLTLRELDEEAQACRTRAAQLAQTIDAQAWDGAWYRRAYFDDGTPLGSKENTEARIDSLPQTWAAISGAGESDRVEVALRSLEENLVREADDLILLFTPPFRQNRRRRWLHQGLPARGAGKRRPIHACRNLGSHGFCPPGRWRQSRPTFANAESGRARPGREGLRTLQGRTLRYARRRLLVSRPRRARRLDLVHGCGSLDLSRLARRNSGISTPRRHASRSTRSYRKIGRAFVCDIVSRTPFIASRSRIQTTVPEVSPWWNWMESRQPTKS